MYATGVLVGAPLWGIVSDRVGRGRILITGLVGYVASSLLLLLPSIASGSGLAGLYALRGATGFFVAAVVPVVATLETRGWLHQRCSLTLTVADAAVLLLHIQQ